MNGLELTLAEQTLASYLLATARTAGFVAVAPPFNTKAVPAKIKAGVAFFLAMPLTPALARTTPDLGSPELALQAVLQVAMGLTLGFLVLVAVSAVFMAGDLIDAVGGFQMSMALDPLMLTETSVFGRLHQMLAATLLMVTDGHLLIYQGLVRSTSAMPVPTFSIGGVAEAVTHQVATMALAAVQIAAPVIAAMVLADMALGLLARAAPALNAFGLGFPLKILATLMLAGLIVARVPGVLEHLVHGAVNLGLQLYGVG